MKPESDPITDDEWLLRRVRVERFRTDKIPLISPHAFEPRIKGRDIDEKGISLYRESCLQSPEEVLAMIDVSRRPEHGIVRVSVTLVKSLGLTVESMHDDRVRGHVLLSELNANKYKEDKASCTPIMLRLAELASKDENIVRTPPMLQDDS